MLLVSQLWQTS
jgi:hypothetical protein